MGSRTAERDGTGKRESPSRTGLFGFALVIILLATAVSAVILIAATRK